MNRWPELSRLCGLLADRDAVCTTAVVAAVDQLEAVEAEHPDVVHQIHVVFGRAAAAWCRNPCGETESALVVAHRACQAITRAADALPDPNLE